MAEILKLVGLFSAGVVAGFINIMAGGGSTITLPFLIFLGLDSALANGTNRIAVFVQNIAAVVSFKQAKYSQFKLSIKLSLWTLPGGILGAIAAVKISNELFQKILGIVIIGIMITLFFPRFTRNSDNNSGKDLFNPWLFYSVMLAIGFYGGFIQAGVGFLIMAALLHLMHLDLVRVNMHKVFIVFMFTLPAIIVFIITNNVKWGYAIVLSAGNAIGGWWSAKVSVKKGERVIRIVLLIAMFLMAMKLLNIF
ncbi:MAG: sulfite exporter TauE/SafE family protein [candidate division KSB1 bacterium]|nr:sulfite exporter TauE/SafE family protein [candidate division KSB1 bacterium]MDZ7335462.1 sulfite exporter TauE/SafE family protein [candidate division KSB1 bacterium]MDZ7358760.1 sulfite exporter TauE/SafE family protein [candidate division KSB1 bacterium]MDZ7400300.1 sulfite exporter TauE/SafE family protein [candidate division KSB1 bacterium]